MQKENFVDINSLSKSEILNSDFIPQIFEQFPDEVERNDVLNEIILVAERERAVTEFNKNLKRYTKNYNISHVNEKLAVSAKFIGSKKDDTTIENFHQAIVNTKELRDSIKFNEFTGRFENWNRSKYNRNWNEDDDAWVMNVIEQKYGICDSRKYVAGLLLCKQELSYHPIMSKIESLKWDGVSRIDRFLTEIMKCDDDDYSREVSRMIFYGGINRLYHPGCKFDYMPILVGEQGTCKSTIVDWLTMGTGSFKTIDTIDDKDSKNLLRYTWIGEFSELIAFVKTRMVESIKAFITTQVDSFRSAYGHDHNDWARHCIFIGTTNNYEFLVDKTGNRRFLPIEVHTNKGDLYDDEKNVKKYIEQCWAEAKVLMDNNMTYMVIPRKYIGIVEKRQKMFMEEDPQENKVSAYLKEQPVGYRVGALELWCDALGNTEKKCNRLDSNNIANYMRSHKNWKKGTSSTTFVGRSYPKARYWEKISEDIDDEE